MYFVGDTHPVRLMKIDNLLREEEGEGDEPNHTTTTKPGPL
jgi:hypothetical protein